MIWPKIVERLDSFVESEDVPVELAKQATIFAAMAGCGCFSVGLLIELLKKHIFSFRLIESSSEAKKAPAGSSEFKSQVKALPKEQRQLLGEIMAHILIFDSLHQPIFGYCLLAMLKYDHIMIKKNGTGIGTGDARIKIDRMPFVWRSSVVVASKKSKLMGAKKPFEVSRELVA